MRVNPAPALGAVVCVVWEDAYQKRSACASSGYTAEFQRSVGFLVSDDSDAIALGQTSEWSWCGECESRELDFLEVLYIPKGMVREVVYLVEAVYREDA